MTAEDMSERYPAKMGEDLDPEARDRRMRWLESMAEEAVDIAYSRCPVWLAKVALQSHERRGVEGL